MAEVAAYYHPAYTYSPFGEDAGGPYPNTERIVAADIPDPIARQPIVVGMYHPSGAILYAGAATADGAADALTKTFQKIKADLPPVQQTVTTVIKTPTSG